METAEILTTVQRIKAMAGRMAASSLVTCSLWLAAVVPALGQLNLAAMADLPDADKYRQLNLMLMVSEGVDEAFLAQLPHPQTAESESANGTMPRLEMEDFQTPLNRIVDQSEMITKATGLFRFVLDNQPDIQRAIREIAASDPEQVAQVDLIQLAEDAIIIRSALSGSIEYLAPEDDPAMAANLATYRERTVYLRNVMEYWKFDQELVAITENAIKDTGGRLAAYQRMLEDEPNLMGFKQHLQAVEEIYRNTRSLRVNPKDLESNDLIKQESQVH